MSFLTRPFDPSAYPWHRTITFGLLFFFIFTSQGSLGQRTPFIPCRYNSQLYKDYKRYMPNQDFPNLTLKLNLIFLQRDDGCCGFSKDNPEHMDAIRRSIAFVNEKYSQLKDPKSDACYTGDDFLPDSKIRFTINEIIEIQDDYLWNLDNGGYCPNDTRWYLNKIDSVLVKDPKYSHAINIYFPNQLSTYEKIVTKIDTTQKLKTVHDCSQLPTYQKLERSSKLNMTNKRIKYYMMKYNVVNDIELNPQQFSWDEAIYYWFWSTMAIGITHELGHTLGLRHSNEYHGANKCEYSIMNQKHGFPKNYLQPTELGKIHRNMRMTNIRDFLQEEVYYPIPWVIDENLNIDVDYKAFEDIIVRSGDTLTVSCHLEMSPQTTIFLEPGAILDLTNGTVTGVRDLSWQGVVNIRKKKCFAKKKKTVDQLSIINPANLSGHKAVTIGKIPRSQRKD